MAINPILNIQTSPDYHVFEFESDGRQRLRKRVQFDLIYSDEHIYNLSLCTVLPDGNLDCTSDTKNGDMDSVLETTAHIGILYINQFPERKVFLRGSDAKRSRKYQMGINRYLMELSKNYFIEGVAIVNDVITSREEIQTGKNYQAFILSRPQK